MSQISNATTILADAMRSALFGIPAALMMSWPWALCALITAVFVFYQFYITVPNVEIQDFGQASGWLVIGVLLLFFVSTISIASVAVNWHRYVLLGEWPRGRNLLRIDARVWRYFENLILVGFVTSLIAVIPLALLGMFGITINASDLVVEQISEEGATLPEGSLLSEYFLTALVSAFVGGLFFRYALKLPAVALGRKDFGLGESWQRTKGTFQLLALVSCGSFVVNALADFAIEKIGLLVADLGALGTAAGLAINILEVWFLGFFGLALLTNLYRRMVEDSPVPVHVRGVSMWPT